MENARMKIKEDNEMEVNKVKVIKHEIMLPSIEC